MDQVLFTSVASSTRARTGTESRLSVVPSRPSTMGLGEPGPPPGHRVSRRPSTSSGHRRLSLSLLSLIFGLSEPSQGEEANLLFPVGLASVLLAGAATTATSRVSSKS